MEIISTLPPIQLELIESTTNSFYSDEFQKMKQNYIVKCYSKLPLGDFSRVKRRQLTTIAAVFSSAYVRDNIFSRKEYLFIDRD